MRQPIRRALAPATLVAGVATALGLGMGVATAADPAVTIVDSAYDPVTIIIQVGHRSAQQRRLWCECAPIAGPGGSRR